MGRRVEAIAAERCEIDPSDKRDVVIDDDQLLVMAMKRPLVVIEGTRDARARDELDARGAPPAASA